MRTFLFASIFTLALWRSAWAGPVQLSWDVMAGATGYRVYQSVDSGTTWTQAVEVTTNTATVQVADDRLVLFRVGAFNAAGEAINFVKGAWYNGKWNVVAAGLRAQ